MVTKVDSNKILGLEKIKIDNALADLKITNRIRRIQELPTGKRRALFEIVDAYLDSNNI